MSKEEDFALKSEMVLMSGSFGDLTATYNRWMMYTKRDVRGGEISNIVQMDYYCPIYKKLRLGLEYYAYWRRAEYIEYPQFAKISKTSYEIKILLNYMI